VRQEREAATHIGSVQIGKTCDHLVIPADGERADKMRRGPSHCGFSLGGEDAHTESQQSKSCKNSFHGFPLNVRSHNGIDKFWFAFFYDDFRQWIQFCLTILGELSVIAGHDFRCEFSDDLLVFTLSPRDEPDEGDECSHETDDQSQDFHESPVDRFTDTYKNVLVLLSGVIRVPDPPRSVYRFQMKLL